MYKRYFAISLFALIAVAGAVFAQGGAAGEAAAPQQLAAIQQKLVAEYVLTQPTADQTDIVTPGSILKLKKGELVMAPVSNPNPYQNTYKNGQITQNALGKLAKWGTKWPGKGSSLTSGAGGSNDRTFVAGEKMWVTKIDVKADGIVFDLFSDPFNDIRYKAALKFPFQKGSIPTVEQADQLVAEVFSALPFDSNGTQQQATPVPGNGGPAQTSNSPAGQASAATPPPSQTTPSAAVAPPAPIAPPSAPADQQPATVSLGMTPDQVVANLGQPTKQVKLGAKTIYIYKDMKVTFVNNKVTDVQ